MQASAPQHPACDACHPPAPISRRLHRRALADHSVVISLTSSDAACAINSTVQNVLRFALEALIILHISCQSSVTRAERGVLASVSPRLVVNSGCITVRPGTGSLLHAHLLNVALMQRYLREMVPRPLAPERLVFAAADTIWLTPGVEEQVLQRESSVYEATALAGSSMVAQITKAMRSDNLVVLTRRNTLVVQKIEGSFYPWRLAADFLALICASGRLARLDAARAMMLESNGCAAPLWLSVEDTLLPTFAATQLNASVLSAAPSKLGAMTTQGQVVGFGGLRRLSNGSWRAMRCSGSCSGATVFARKAWGSEGHSCP